MSRYEQDSVLEAEKFERHLAELAAMSPEEKRKYARRIEERENRFCDKRRALREERAEIEQCEEEWKRDEPEWEQCECPTRM